MLEPLDERSLGERLVASGRLTQQQFDKCLAMVESQRGSKRVGLLEIFVAQRFVTSEEIEETRLEAPAASPGPVASEPGGRSPLPPIDLSQEAPTSHGQPPLAEPESGRGGILGEISQRGVDELPGDLKEELARSGETIGRYAILSKVGQGGMGIVYRAWDSKMRRVVALKTIRAGRVSDELMERFYREARAAGSLTHPSIVQVYDVFDADGDPAIVMRFVEGVPLDKKLRGPMSPEEAVELGEEMALALHHAHENGVVHRDVKPANIMVDADGRPFLTDFGLARDATATQAQLTATGQVLGSPSYMSPEQVNADHQAIGPATDVYGLGATLYRALAGQPPFTGSSAAVLFKQILVDVPRDLRKVNPQVPESLSRVVMRCLKKAPSRRHGSAAALARALERSLRPGADSSRIPVMEQELPRKQPRWGGKIAAVSGGVLLLAGLALGSFLVGVGKNDQGELLSRGGFPKESIQPNEPASEPPSVDQAKDAIPEVYAGRAPDEVLTIVRSFSANNPKAYEEIRYRFQELIDRFQGTASNVPEEARLEIQALDVRIGQELAEACEVIPKLAEAGRYREAMEQISSAKERFKSADALERLDALREGVLAAGSVQLTAAREAVAKALETRDTELADALLLKLASCGLPIVEGKAAEQQKTLVAARARWRREARQKASVEFERHIEIVAMLLMERKYRSARGEIEQLAKKVDQAQGPKLTSSQRQRVIQLAHVIKSLERFFDLVVANLVTYYKDIPFQARHVRGRVREADEAGLVTLLIGSRMKVIDLASNDVVGTQLMAAYQRKPAQKPQDASLDRICFSVLEGLPVLEDDVETLNAVSKADSGGLGMSADALISELRRWLGSRLPKPGEGKPADPKLTDSKLADPAPARRGRVSRSKVSDKELTQFIPIQAGSFQMGSSIGESDESPRRLVILSSYAIGKYEVVNRTYAQFLAKLRGRKHSSRFCHPQEPPDKADHVPEYWDDPRWNGDIHPVVGVDWWDAYACARAFGCRLPTEAEWERSARVRGRTREYLNFPWGNSWDFTRVNSMARWLGKATYSPGNQDEFDRLVRERREAGEGMTMPVTELPEGRSPIGAHHMAGNVAEWCHDWYDPVYYFKATGAFGEPDRNPTGPETGTERTWRGGSWARDLARSSGGTIVNLLRAPYRQCSTPDSRSHYIGFRLVQELE